MITIPALSTFLLALAAQRVAVPQATAEVAPVEVFTIGGQALTPQKTPAAGVAMTVGLHRYSEVLSAVDVITDEEGRFSVEVPFPVADGDDDGRRMRRKLCAYACPNLAGYQRMSTRRMLSAEGDALDLGSIVLREGATIRLRVLDRDGEPLMHGSVGIESFDGDPKPYGDNDFTFGGPARAVRANGTREAVFDVHFHPRKSASLLLRASGRGAAWLPDVTPGTTDEITARLAGTGRLAGELVDPDGTPLAGVKLAAYPVELLEEPYPDRAAFRVRNVRETIGGLFTDTRTTDADGRFTFDGLQPGSYFLRQVGSRASGTIERAPLPTGTTSRVVLALHRLVVEVTTPEELALDGRPYCTRLPARGHYAEIDTCRGSVGEHGELRWSWDVVPDARYAVGWLGDGLGLEREVTIRPGSFVTRVDLRIEERTAPARLELAFENESGGPYDFAGMEELRIWLLSGRTGVAVLVEDVRSATTELSVAPGEYELHVEPSHVTVMCGSGMGARARSRLWRGPALSTVWLAPGEERRLVVVPWDGGRVRVHLELPEIVRDARLLPKPTPDDEAQRRDDLLQASDGPHATIFVDDEDEPLRFYLLDNDRHSGALQHMLPGTAAVSLTVLRPGPHVLRIEAPGFLPETVRIHVVANEVVDAHVRLRDRE